MASNKLIDRAELEKILAEDSSDSDSSKSSQNSKSEESPAQKPMDQSRPAPVQTQPVSAAIRRQATQEKRRDTMQLMNLSSSDSEEDEFMREINREIEKKTQRQIKENLNKKAQDSPAIPGGRTSSGCGQSGQKKAAADSLHIENLLNEETSSEESDDDKPKVKSYGISQGTKKMGASNRQTHLNHAKNLDLIQLVEHNEKMNEVVPERVIEQASQLLSFNKDYYEVKKQILIHSSFSQIQTKLFQQHDHRYYGLSTCLTMFDNYIFVGNSIGIIRVFDTKTNKEMKPLLDEQLQRKKVVCIHITDSGAYLCAGYKEGTVALFDLAKYKMMKIMDDIHTSEVTAAKVYFTNDEMGIVNFVSAEETGRVRLTEVTRKNLFGGFNHTTTSLFEKRLKNTMTISLQHVESEFHPSEFCDKKCLAAFGAANEVVICSLNPIAELMCIKKPTLVRNMQLPYIDWGYGLTPTVREQTVPICAVAWDQIIQLVYINDHNHTIEMDGYYCSEHEIHQVCFMGDSILIALVNERFVKVLYTTKFQPGEFKQLEMADSQTALKQQFYKTVELTRYCELETGHEVQGIRPAIHPQIKGRHFNPCVSKCKKTILYLCNKEIHRSRILSWREYLDKLKHQDNFDWLTVLKAALEIYNGDLKGFAKVPDEKELRERQLQSFMKDMILDSIQTVIQKFTKRDPNPKDLSDETNYSVDAIAIKVSIEFCLNINASEFLFSEIFDIFKDSGLQNEFVKHLEPFIISGQFRKQSVPQAILRQLIRQYEKESKFKVLEKIIQQLDLSDYQHKEDLFVVCQHNCMVSALLYLFTSGSTDNAGCMQILNTMYKMVVQTHAMEQIRQKKEAYYKAPSKRDIREMLNVDSQRRYELEKSHCYIGYKLLWIIKMFLEGKRFPYGALKPHQWKQHVHDIVAFMMTDEYLSAMLDFDSEQFFKVISKLFFGQPYKFLMEMPIESIASPEQIQKLEQKAFIENIIIHELQERAEMHARHGKKTTLDAFFTFVLQVQVGQFQDQSEKNLIAPGQSRLDINTETVYKAIVMTLEQDLNPDELLDDPKSVDQELIIGALEANKFEESQVDFILDLISKKGDQSLSDLQIHLFENKRDYAKALQLQIDNFCAKTNNNKESIFEWVRNRLTKLTDEQIRFKEIQNRLKTLKKSGLMVGVMRFKKKQRSEQGVKESSDSDEEKKDKKEESDSSDEEKIVSNVAKALKRETASHEPLETLFKAIELHMKGLAAIDVKETLKLIEQSFNYIEFQQQFVFEDLNSTPEVQFRYLLNYIQTYEKEIEETIKEAAYQPEKQEQAKRFASYLVLFTRLLCEFDGQFDEKGQFVNKGARQGMLIQGYGNLNSSNYNSTQRQLQTVESWVRKEYFPIGDCLAVCRRMKHQRGEAVLVKRQGNYLEAIQIYLQIISKISVKEMLEQMATKERDYRKTSSPEWDVGKVSRFERGMSLFDEILELACKVAEKLNSSSAADKDAGWFMILEYLQEYSISARNHCEIALKPTSQKVTTKSSIDFEVQVDRLKDFVNKRVNFILQREHLDISLSDIMERLNLEFLQIQKLYDTKLRVTQESMKMQFMSETMLRKDLNWLFQQVNQRKTQGFLVERNESCTAVHQQKIVLPELPRCDPETPQICGICKHAIILQVQVVPFQIFDMCGHMFHEGCMSDKMTCLLCNRVELQEEIDFRGRRRQSVRAERRSSRASEMSTTSSSPLLSGKNPFKNMIGKASNDLRMKQMIAFDSQMKNCYLRSRDFQDN